MSWWDVFTVVDVETTGVSADKDRVLELGVARFERGQLVEKCNYVIYQDMHIDPKLERINGLTAADVAGGYPFDEVWVVAADLFADAVPVAYNAPFDRRFLEREIRLARCSTPESAHVHGSAVWLDPLVWCRHLDGGRRGHKLTEVCARRGIVIEKAHQAVWDAVATGELLVQIAPSLPADTDAAVEQQLALAVDQAHARAGRDGCVLVCDTCHARTFCQNLDKLPGIWRRESDWVTCSDTCEVQRLDRLQGGSTW